MGNLTNNFMFIIYFSKSHKKRLEKRKEFLKKMMHMVNDTS